MDMSLFITIARFCPFVSLFSPVILSLFLVFRPCGFLIAGNLQENTVAAEVLIRMIPSTCSEFPSVQQKATGSIPVSFRTTISLVPWVDFDGPDFVPGDRVPFLRERDEASPCRDQPSPEASQGGDDTEDDTPRWILHEFAPTWWDTPRHQRFPGSRARRLSPAAW
jgi:hypothetical protein